MSAARDFAIEAHGDQRYGDGPYVVHLDAVAEIVRSWGFSGAVEDAAYLHDVLEDTETDLNALIDAFGWRVHEIVYACTAPPLRQRGEKMAAIYAKVAKDGSGAVVKLADRIANLEASEPGSRHAERYLGEHDAFSQALKPYVPAFAWDRYVAGIKRLMVELVEAET